MTATSPMCIVASKDGHSWAVLMMRMSLMSRAKVVYSTSSVRAIATASCMSND